ncbi:aspartic proteinase nepenthesin-2 [Arachis duranensis]|uniref:Aspartic proteinase nepenthesin-2 n=1 Tax=Arachis duranensis TaxID=130453 RepID=A0A6P4BFK8_ARADU|nr:aspartic proteinase nepenthesin-2 [Arachis duranensis]
MASSSTTILLLPLLFLLNFTPTKSDKSYSYINSINNNDGFSISLIHRDSPLSPLYNDSTSSLKGRGPMACLNMPRSLVGSSLLSQHLMNGDDVSAQVVYDRCQYIASYYIGTPPQQVYAFIDTASDITWTNARTAFQSSMSKTYRSLLCNDKTCKLLEKRICKNENDDEACTYKLEYEEGPSTYGVLSKDKFWFDADGPSGQSNSPRDVGVLSFGLNHDVSPVDFNGLDVHGSLGLSRDPPFSLIHQLGVKRFSHCFVRRSSGGSSSLHFGSKAVIHPEDATPLVQLPSNEPQLYYVDLEGISVGNRRANIPPAIFKRTSDRRGGFLIDSASRYTMLRSDAYDAFLNLVKEMVTNVNIVPYPPEQDTNIYKKEFCFTSTNSTERELLPRVTLHFAGGVDLQLINDVVYIEYVDPLWCLAILRSDSKDDVSFLGNIQMMNLNIGFDLENNKVSFTNTVCAASGYNEM